MKIKADPVSHLSYLVMWLQQSQGDVVELGMGVGSTLVMHEMCRHRHLVSYEHDQQFFDKFADFRKPWHEIIKIDKWEDAQLERPWGLAFVDNNPTLERRNNILRLKPWADYILVHDTERRNDRHYHTREIFGLFKFARSYKEYMPHTTILSDKYPV